MPWCWHPLWGAFWVDKNRVKDKHRQKDTSEGDSEYKMKTFNTKQTYNSNYSVEKEKFRNKEEKVDAVPAKEEVKNSEKSFLKESLNSKFNQVRPGVYTFARGNAPKGETTGSEKFLPVTSSNVPSSMSGFKKLGMSKEGLPIYTYT